MASDELRKLGSSHGIDGLDAARVPLEERVRSVVGQSGRHTTFVTPGVPVHLLALVTFVVPWVSTVPISLSAVLLAITVSARLPLVLLRALTAVQRDRLWALLGVDG